jgi:hypothetical protein
MKLIFLNLILLLSINASCQNKLINGRVIDETLEFIPMAIILNSENIEIGKTDLEGYFKIEIPIDEHQIKFYFIGFESSIIRLEKGCDYVEVIMLLSGTYDFKSLKKVDRIIKRKLKKLPRLHTLAYERGIFLTKKGCYIQEIATTL